MKKTHIGLMIILLLLAILWFVFLELNQNFVNVFFAVNHLHSFCFAAEYKSE